MKWFKHLTDAHTNLKLRSLLNSYGLKGYGVWWMVCEMCARSGKSVSDWCLFEFQDWKNEIQRLSGVDRKWLNRFLKKLTKLHLVDESELKKGNLCIPQMSEYCDDYTDRVRRKYEHTTDNVPLDKNRIDKNRIDKSKIIKKFPE